ncbi:hypothetical protein [Paenarthrobacter ilicis]|uniref:Pimeloyl-ACP methyl ester carboxylesterase n=1 Tax=Paenarthrobacter ilicis TaxID=43665 RepID=A0ABX0TQG2_9MICC|nr:hypothetical protein [Paenarthrobacter ilicis]MBM7794804.1 pimeloyl-ACP methyl ester carboxylesterase [Paenarthrobacter ilicis]NIJ02897.1 pimeloyl-ACP methyl ester carboxylesterase [Paenarthrobacter ilicis]
MTDVAAVGAGSAPTPTEPPPDGFLTIRGGVGGMSFQLEELLRGAGYLEGMVQQLLEVEAETLRIQHSLEPFLRDSFHTGCLALDAIAGSRNRLATVRQDLAEVGSAVRSSHHDYLETEARNARPHAPGFDQFRASGAPWPFNLGRDLAEEAFNRLIPDSFTSADVLRPIMDNALLADLQPRHVNVLKMEESSVEINPSMAESLRRTEQLHARNDGEIEVIQFGSGGSSSWMVLIPGTQPDSPSTNPFDIAGIGEAMAYHSAQVAPAIRQALRDAGARPGQEVVAVGHSQGGIHAMNLAQDKAFLGEFNLKYVLTAGSPVGDITPEPGISSLHLEHVQDWVPGTDGRVNQDTKDRVTVTLTNDVATPGGADPGLGPGHDQENYASGAELVARSKDESLAASAAAFAAVVGAGGAAKVTRYKLERAPVTVHSGTPADTRRSVRETKREAATR